MLFHFGEGVRLEKLPLGSRIVYPPDPLEPIAHPERAIKRALAKPLEDDPLKSLLRRGMKLTIAFDDLSLPLPPMAAPDVRQLVMEEVIDMAAEAGVEDIHLIAALGLHRRMTEDEMRHIVGDRIFTHLLSGPPVPARRRGPGEQRLHRQDRGGRGGHAHRRAAESDLVVYVNLTLVPMDGGHKSMATGLASYRGIRAHHNVKTLLGSRSYMNPPDSALHHSCIRQGQLIEDTVRVFHIETTVNNHAFPAIANFMQKRETDWTAQDQAMFLAMKQIDRPRAARVQAQRLSRDARAVRADRRCNAGPGRRRARQDARGGAQADRRARRGSDRHRHASACRTSGHTT